MERIDGKLKPLSFIASIAIVLSCFLTGCESKYAYKKADVSNIKSEIKFQRFEQDFSKITAENYDEYTAQLSDKYGSFYEDYVRLIMGFGSRANSPDTIAAVKTDILNFLSNEAINGLFDTVSKMYPDMSTVEKELNMALRHFYFYFPDKKITTAYTFISEFSYGSVTYSDSVLAVGLDMYLGESYPYYASFDIPNYVARKLNRNFIALNCMEVLYQLHFGSSAYNENAPLIEAMVEEGKKLYFLECMMPEAHDSLIIGYRAVQEKFCRETEKQVWEFFVSRDLLYSVNIMDHKRYTLDGPSTGGMPQEAPGKVGAWVGWQIVRKFMKESKGAVSLNDLLTKTDAKKIISKAKYKP